MRRVVRKPFSEKMGNGTDHSVAPPNIDVAFRRYAVASARASDQKDVANKQREVLLAYAEDHGEEDTKGHRSVELADEFTVPGGKTLSGFTREKRVSERLNLERIEALAAEKGLTSRIFPERKVKVFDEAELYAAYQEDLITDEELKSLIDVTTTYALKVH
ncbi:hypothetical protein AB0K16_22410 [Nonomuraea jabiensis]|uniref:hypothetical protein n=1 Tax=Nonomuraea jabiensis TaxID=882448 RepID=UPI00341A5CC1